MDEERLKRIEQKIDGTTTAIQEIRVLVAGNFLTKTETEERFRDLREETNEKFKEVHTEMDIVEKSHQRWHDRALWWFLSTMIGVLLTILGWVIQSNHTKLFF